MADADPRDRARDRTGVRHRLRRGPGRGADHRAGGLHRGSRRHQDGRGHGVAVRPKSPGKRGPRGRLPADRLRIRRRRRRGRAPLLGGAFPGPGFRGHGLRAPAADQADP